MRIRSYILWHCTAAVVLLSVALAAPAAFAQQARANRSRSFGPDACGPVDPTYIYLANETGGQPMFFQRSEAAKAVEYVGEISGENRTTLLWVTDTLEGAEKEFTVPVDTSIQKVVFSLSSDTKGNTLTVGLPNGGEAAAGDTGTKIIETNCARVVSVQSPAAGEWRVRVGGSGRFWLQAHAKSEIFLIGTEFVREGGRPGHEGLFRIPGQPLAGSPATLEVSLSGPIENAAFMLVSEAGGKLKPVTLAVASSRGDEKEYVGQFDLPKQPFRLGVTGLDSKGEAYQRIFHTLFHAETVEVAPPGLLEDVLPGKTTTLTFEVRNVGSPASFRIVVADSRKFVSRVEPKELTLGKGDSAKVAVDVKVPADTPLGTGFDVTITASSTTGPPTTNGAVQHLSVYSPSGP